MTARNLIWWLQERCVRRLQRTRGSLRHMDQSRAGRCSILGASPPSRVRPARVAAAGEVSDLWRTGVRLASSMTTAAALPSFGGRLEPVTGG
jgi:hypothetical protein